MRSQAPGEMQVDDVVSAPGGDKGLIQTVEQQTLSRRTRWRQKEGEQRGSGDHKSKGKDGAVEGEVGVQDL